MPVGAGVMLSGGKGWCCKIVTKVIGVIQHDDGFFKAILFFICNLVYSRSDVAG